MSTNKPDLTRVWASGASSSNIIDPDVTTSGKVAAGWHDEVPTYQHFNYIQNWLSAGLAHNNEQGVNVWDASTTYPLYGYAKGSDGELYKSTVASNTGNDPTTSSSHWTPFGSSTIVESTDLSHAQNRADLFIGSTVYINERIISQGGAGVWDVVDSSGVTPNTYNIVQHDNDSSLALVLRVPPVLSMQSWGVQNNGTDSSAAFQHMLDTLPAGWRIFAEPNDLSFGQASYIKFTASTGKPFHIDFRDILVEPASTTDTHALRFAGTASSTTYDLALSASRGEVELEVNSTASDIGGEDFIVLRDESETLSGGITDINMEVHQVSSVGASSLGGGDVVTLSERVNQVKSKLRTPNLYRIDMVNGPVVQNFNYRSVVSGTANQGLVFDMCTNVIVEGLKSEQSTSNVLDVRRSYNVKVNDWSVKFPSATTTDQGCGLSFSHGTRHIHIGSGRGEGMRHTLSLDSCYHITSDWITSINTDGQNDIMINVNGYGGDIEELKVRVQKDTASRGVLISKPLTATYNKAYSLPCHNINIRLVANMPVASGANAFESENCLINSNINITATHGWGAKPTSWLTDISACRIPSDACRGSSFSIRATGSMSALYRNDNTGSPATLGDARFKLWTVNTYHGAYLRHTAEINIDLIDVNNCDSSAIKYEGSNTLKSCTINNATYKGITSAPFNVTTSNMHSDGVSGTVSNVCDDEDHVDHVTITGTSMINQEQMHKSIDGKTIFVTPASTLTTLPATPFANGIYSGQVLVLVTVHASNSLVIPHGGNVVNNGGIDVGLNSVRRSASWIYDSIDQLWYQFDAT